MPIVVSQNCTTAYPDLGLVLLGGIPTEVSAEVLPTVLDMPGVVAIPQFPEPKSTRKKEA